MGLSRGTLTVSIMTVQLNLSSQQETQREKSERAELFGSGGRRWPADSACTTYN